MFRYCAGFCSSAVIAISLASSAYTAEPVTNAGTLTCTLAPSKELPVAGRTEAPVSCRFVSITGNDFQLSGRMLRMSTSEERSAEIVVAWSVVARTASIASQDLSGTYTGEMSSGSPANSGILFGGKEGGIELRSLSAGSTDAVPDAGLTVLELELAAVKV